MTITDTAEKKEKVILVAIETGADVSASASLDELGDLADTAGAMTVGRLIQVREAPHPGTYIGKGKIEELKFMITEHGAESVICDDELSPAQMSNLGDMLDVKVIDRTVLILDIFASHARSGEGKLQVELAQLRYRSSHLVGMGKIMSRLGGGIGTRGPGETKLETDRRLIRDRISVLNKRLRSMVQNREIKRSVRSESNIPTVAIVGYTNAGKSTLMNYLTGADVLSEDKLFATLDTTTRSMETEQGQKFLFTDTVGFINKLPHTLIKAFRSTLEEAGYADIIMHVVDLSNPAYEDQMRVVYDTLKELDITGKPILTVFNKMDIVASPGVKREPGPVSPKVSEGVRDRYANETVFISAGEGYGVDELISKLIGIADDGMIGIEKLFGFDEAGKINYIRTYGRLIEEKYLEEGIMVKARIPADGMHRIE